MVVNKLPKLSDKMKRTKSLIIMILVIISSLTIVTPTTIADFSKGKPTLPPGKKPPTVTITNPADGVTVSGVITITIEATDKEDGPLIPSLYIDGEFIANTNSYEWDTTTSTDGLHTIYAEASDSGRKTDSDTITVTVDNANPPPPPPTGVEHYVVIVGISDYRDISDLEYCDDDARDWKNYFQTLGYEHITTLIDSQASKASVTNALTDMVNTADSDDVIAFVSSGHGGKDRSNHAYLCMWDSDPNVWDNDLEDTELAAILDDAIADRIFVFLDHCSAGGFGDDLMAMPNKAHVYLTTTCTLKGYGYDDPDHQNGMWTWYFEDYSLIQHFNSDPYTTMEDAFDYAFAAYPRNKGNDAPQEFDGVY
ncbi:MAG: caspase family protein [Candidatus Heimdallarchaeaceae archaeon]